MISPTWKGIRGTDKHGSGEYSAPRTHGYHRGVDFVCEPGQDVVMPISAEIIRIAKPYANEKWLGVYCKNSICAFKMFYLIPKDGVIGEWVDEGEIIGIAQDISEKYPGITPHIHFEFESVDPMVFFMFGGF